MCGRLYIRALKQWRCARVHCSGASMDDSHVLGLLAYQELERDAAEYDPRLKGESKYHFLIVMDRADGDLSDALSHSRIAGRSRDGVIEIAHQVAGHLSYLNEDCHRLHGDIKPRNVVKIAQGTRMKWTLIDLDASCAIGDEAGQKVTSSACFPPEMARWELAKSGRTSQEEVHRQLAERERQLETLDARRDRKEINKISNDIDVLEATLAQGATESDVVTATIGFEMWYFGVLLYQLCTLDGKTLWTTDQADNIELQEMQDLAYQWPQIKAAKLKKIVWPQAAHLVGWLLHEDPNHRPRSWDQVKRHPFLLSEGGPETHKHIVMSCPEMGTLDSAGGPPYDQLVMDKVSELQQIGYVKFGFDRAGTSTARKKDEALFTEAAVLRSAGRTDEAKALLKTTDWWYGYETSVKQAVKLESQGFDGVLNVTCIRGGDITQLEAEEMERIMCEATRDCAKSGVTVTYEISKVSYCEFLSEYGPAAYTEDLRGWLSAEGLSRNGSLVQVSDDVIEVATEGTESAAVVHGDAIEHQDEFAVQLVQLQATNVAQDEELTALGEKLTAQDEELTALRALLQSQVRYQVHSVYTPCMRFWGDD